MTNPPASDPTPDPDQDLTAYALGELSPDSAEHAAVEARLAQDEAARDEVQAVRAAADQLAAALAAEPLPPEAGRATLAKPPRRWSMHLAVAGSLAAAAVIVVALLLPSLGAARRSVSTVDARETLLAVEDVIPPSNEQPKAHPALADDIRGLLSDQAQATDAPELALSESLASTNQPSAWPHQSTLFGDADGDAARGSRVWYGHVQGDWGGTVALNDNFAAGVLRDAVEESEVAVDYKKLRREMNLSRASERLTSLDAAVPYSEIIRYPEDWPQLSEALIEYGLATGQTLSPQLALVELETARRGLVASGLGEDHSQVKKIDQQIVYFRQFGEIDGRPNTEAYDRVEDNPFLAALDNPLSTFSIDVDTASYANVRRFLMQQGTLPPADAVRIEEMVNYFDYGYAPPEVIRAEDAIGQDDLPGVPFAAHVQVAAAPWSTSGGRLVRIGLKGVEVATDDRPAANLVFLLDVSGSMNRPNKLPLVKAGMKTLVEHLKMDDRIAIVVYAGASGLVLDSTTDHDAVLAAIDNLVPGGSTNGAAGIELAYQIAAANHIDGGLNRVILCTDGDFNVGITDRGALTRLIETKANLPGQPVTLTVLGFGNGNLKDATMEELSNRGDGNYGYVDSRAEAEKLLAEQVNATLLTIAKDVKIQVEFNPRKVASYRLIGYENRLLAKEDFNNDTVDAGDIGAGHTVTALYEVVPVGAWQPPPAVNRVFTPEELERQRELERTIRQLRTQIERLGEPEPSDHRNRRTRTPQTDASTREERARQRWAQQLSDLQSELAETEREMLTLLGINEATPIETAVTPAIDPLKYQRPAALSDAADTGELLTLKLRYKEPNAPKQQGTSKLLEFPVQDSTQGFEDADEDFRFAASVAGFGMLLRGSPYAGDLDLATVQAMAEASTAGWVDRRGELTPDAERRLEFIELVKRARGLATPAVTTTEEE